MYAQLVETCVIDEESLPWIPFLPYSDRVMLKYFKLDPVRGETIVLVKCAPGVQLPRHRVSGNATIYTLEGRWKFQEYEWIAGPGSLVYETAASCHTPEMVSTEGHVLTLQVHMGDWSVLDPDGRPLATENWKTALQRYLAHCDAFGILPRDLTAFH